MIFLLGLVILLFSLGFSVILLGGDVMNFINIPSLLFIIGPILAVLTATQSFKAFYAGCKAAIFPKEIISEKSRKQAISLFRLLSKTAGISAVIAILIIFLNILLNLDFYDSEGIPPLVNCIAVVLTSLFYGLLLIVAVFEPMVFILKKRRNNERGS